MTMQPHTNPDASFIRRLGMIAAVIVAMLLLVTLVWQMLWILLLLFAGMVIGVAFDNIRNAVCRATRLPSWLGLLIVVLTSVAMFVLFVVIAAPTLAGQSREIRATLEAGWEQLEQTIKQYSWGRQLLNSDDGVLNAESMTWLNEQGVINGLTKVFTGAFGAVTSLLIAFLVGVYLAAEPTMYLNGVVRLFPVAKRDRLIEVGNRIGHVLKWWLVGQLCSMVILGVAMTAGLMILGVPLALAIGLFTALMTFIPNLGPMIAAVPAVLMALTVSPTTALYTLILVLIIQNLEGSVITPLIHRRIIALPPLLIITVQLLLGYMAGFFGVLVAVPIVATAMVLVQELYVRDVLEKPHEQASG